MFRKMRSKFSYHILTYRYLFYIFFYSTGVLGKLTHISWKEGVCSDWDKFLQIVLLKKQTKALKSVSIW